MLTSRQFLNANGVQATTEKNTWMVLVVSVYVYMVIPLVVAAAVIVAIMCILFLYCGSAQAPRYDQYGNVYYRRCFRNRVGRWRSE